MGIPIAKIAEGTVPTQKAVEPLYPLLPAEYGYKTDTKQDVLIHPLPALQGISSFRKCPAPN